MENHQNQRKHIIFLIIIVIAVLTIGGRAYYYSQKNTDEEQSISNEKRTSESEILGSWSAQTGGLEEEIAFSIDDAGIHHYNSWLHDRPAESGTWILNNGQLTIIYNIPETSPILFKSVVRQGNILILKDSSRNGINGIYSLFETQ